MCYKNLDLYKRIIFVYIQMRVKAMSWFTSFCACIYSSSSKNLFLKKILKMKHLQYMDILSLDIYALEKKSEFSLIEGNRKGISPEIVYSFDEKPKIHTVPIPDLYLVHLSNITIHSNNDSVCDFNRGILLNDFAYDMNPKFSAKSQLVYGTQGNFALVRTNISYGKDIDSGIMLAANFSQNYYHIIYEVLPRLAVAQNQSIPFDVPLLVDECIRNIPQFKSAFDKIYDNVHPIIWLEEGKYYNVKDLYFVSPVHMFPGQVILIKNLQFEDSGFDIDLLANARKKYLEAVDLQSSLSYPKRLFISRKGHNRRSYNEDELFEVASKYGFEKVQPENLSFEEQIKVFNNADVILGASGAALSNLLFCHKGAKSVCFFSQNVNSPTFTIGAYLSESELIYLIGEKVKSNTSPYSVHTDFKISPSDLFLLLERIC